MQDDAVMTRFAAKLGASQGVSETDNFEDLGTYSVIRGAREWVQMLQIRKKCGSIVALSYSLLERVEYDPSGVITVKFGDAIVKIRGRNLNAQALNHVGLLAALVRHRVTYIQESDQPTAMLAPKDAAVIEQVEIE